MAALFMSLWSSPTVGHADGGEEAGQPDLEYSGTITNNVTGEVIELDFEVVSMPASDGGTLSIEAVFDPGLAPDIGGAVAPMTSIGNDWENASFRARLTVNYDTSGTRLRINTVSGSWTPKNRQVSVWGRTVITAQDPWTARRMEKRPAKNTFSYAPGWGWGVWYSQTPYSGSGATSQATWGVTGMASFTTTIQAKIPGPS